MIRLATEKDLPEIKEIYEKAKEFMRRNGNPNQWTGNYPHIHLLEADIKNNHLYVIESSDNPSELCGCFFLAEGVDPTYLKIDGPGWLSNEPYAAIHKVASNGKEKGIFNKCVEFARKSYTHLRIDTHEQNIPMQNAILKNGFEHRGTIYLADGSPRMAYEWILK